jgi:hypothetical protein
MLSATVVDLRTANHARSSDPIDLEPERLEIFGVAVGIKTRMVTNRQVGARDLVHGASSGGDDYQGESRA